MTLKLLDLINFLSVTWRWGCDHRTISAECPWRHSALHCAVSENPIWACQRLHLHLLMISHIINCKCKCSVSKCFRCSGAVSECSGAKSKCSGAVSRDNSKRYTYTTLQLQLGLETTVTSSDCVVWNAPNQRPKRECHHMTVIAADNRARFTVSGYECQVSQDISRKCYRFTLFQ